MKLFLQRWAVTTFAVLVAAHIVSGISYGSIPGLLVASLLLGVFNAVLRPLMFLLALPLVIVTLGLFTLVINAFLLYLVGWMAKDFHVASFGAAFWGSLIISLVSLAANFFFGPPKQPGGGSDPGQRPPPPPGNGPVIDV